MAPPNIGRIALEGMFGRHTVDVPIRDNRLILAGANGIGKSTFINAFYYFVSRQWSRLLHYDFHAITVQLDNTSFSIKKSDIESFESISEVFGSAPTRYRRFMEQLLTAGELESFLSSKFTSNQITYYSDVLGIPRSELEHLRAFVRRRLGDTSDLFTYQAQRLTETFKEIIHSRILYLPTYRRIERDLSFIFPGLEEEISRYQRRSAASRRADHFLELVSFGMEDVQENITATLAQLKEEARTTMNSLAASYLRDVIREEATAFDRTVITSLTDDDVTRILDRVEERTLSEKDKQSLRDVIEQLRQRGRGRLKSRQKYVAHFFSKLVEAAQNINIKERRIRQFANTCNRYLVNKDIYYDEVEYSIRIHQGDRDIELSQLSSGEKQIVSLFSHLFLQPGSNFIIIIDEPELSLSTPWQKTFLPDIIASGRCDALIAVTHSPFIFDNDLRHYASDLRKYTVDSGHG